VAVYAANSNFVFFSAQFSYESLALPLLVVVLFACAEWRSSSGRTRVAYACAIVLLIFTVVATHHLTSYALAVALIAIAVAYALQRVRHGSPAKFAAFAVVAAALWLVVVASKTVGYLSPVVRRALTSVLHTISGEGAPRQLFASRTGITGSGPLGQAVAIAAVVVLAVLYPFGAFRIWRSYRRDPYAIVLGIGGGLVFATYALRLAPDAWETANRSTEFLFLGLAAALPLSLLRLGARLGERTFAICASGALTLAFAGGVISGWTPSLRLSQPYEISAEGNTIQAEGRAMAAWASQTLGPGKKYAAADADARLLDTYADGFARAGQGPDIIDILKTPTLDPWQVRLLHELHVRYVVIDRRLRAFDNTGGYYFGYRKGPRRDRELPQAVVDKFRRFNRIYDSGNIVIFDFNRR
jgi:hypothetical protein